MYIYLVLILLVYGGLVAGRYFGRAEYISHFGQAETLVYTLCDIVKSLFLFFGSKEIDISINCQSRVGGRDSNKSK